MRVLLVAVVCSAGVLPGGGAYVRDGQVGFGGSGCGGGVAVAARAIGAGPCRYRQSGAVMRGVVPWLVAAVGAAGCAFLVAVMVVQGLAVAGLWAGPLAALAGFVAAVAAVWAVRPPARQTAPPPAVRVPEWVVGRPGELAAVVAALAGGGGGAVGITTGLYGAGGFGKTTLAQMACADRRVRRRFGGRVYLVTVGRDVRGPAAVAAKVNDVIKLISGEDATSTDPQLAGAPPE